MGNSHSHTHNSDEKLQQTSGGGCGGDNGIGENINLNGKHRRNSRVRDKVFGRFGHKKSKDNTLCETSKNVELQQSSNKIFKKTKRKLSLTADNENFTCLENIENSPTISPLSADLEWNLGEKFEQILQKQKSADTDTARDVLLLDESPFKGDDGQPCNIQLDYQQQCISNLGSERKTNITGYEYNSDEMNTSNEIFKMVSCNNNNNKKEYSIIKNKKTSTDTINFEFYGLNDRSMEHNTNTLNVNHKDVLNSTLVKHNIGMSTISQNTNNIVCPSFKEQELNNNGSFTSEHENFNSQFSINSNVKEEKQDFSVNLNEIKLNLNLENLIEEKKEFNQNKKIIERKSVLVQTDSWKLAKKIHSLNINRQTANRDYDDLDNCEVIILKEKSTSSSDSNFTDPLTPIGFSTELNECYISEENICDELPLKNLTKSITKNNLKTKHQKNLLNKEDILSKLSVSKIYYFNLDDTTKSDDSPEDDLEMATNLRNKLAQMLNSSDGEQQQQAIHHQQKNQLSPSTETVGLFNVAKAKKVELHNLSSRIPDNNLNASGMPTSNFKPQNLSTATSPTKEILTNQNTGSFFSSFGESNVLKKVASFITAEKSGCSTPTTEHAHKTVIDKPSFSIFEKFEGQMLLKWFSSSISINNSINEMDLNKIILQYCTNLLSIGVIKPITEKNKLEFGSFNPYQMYQWAFKESPTVSPKLGKLDTDLVWPPPMKCDDREDDDEDSLLNDLYQNGRGVDRKVFEIKKSLLNCTNLTDLYEVIETLMPDRKPSNKIQVPLYLQSDILNETDLTLYDFDVQQKKELQKDVCIQINNITCCECNSNSKKTNVKYATKDTQTEPISPAELEKASFTTDVEKKLDDKPKNQVEIPPPPPAPPIPPPPPPSNNFNEIPLSSAGMTGSNINIPIAPPVPPPNLLSSVCPPPPPMPSTNSSNIIGPPPPPPPSLNSQINGPPTVPSAVKSDIPAPLPPPNSGTWFQANSLRKNAVNPPKPMKPLYWTRIVAPKPLIPEEPSECPVETDTVDSYQPKQLWQEIDETCLDNIDEFTDLFSRQAMVPKQKPEKQQPVRVKTLKILDSKRSQNVGIFARSLHFDFEEIEHAVYHCDTSIVSLEILQHIREIKAKPDELELIREAASRGDTPLDPPEQFLLKIAQISLSEERITCIVFQADFDEASIQIYRKLDVVKQLCQFLTENENIKSLFSIILTLGNYMNGGNRSRGQADGFGLEILGKLKDVKSKDSKITLLHFIVKTYIDRKRKGGTPLPEVEIPIPEPSDIEKAVAVDFDEVKEQIKELSRKLNVCKSTTEKVIASSNKNNVEPFKSKMELFIEKGTRKIEKQLSKLEDCRIVFIKTMKFYYFIPKSGTLEQCTPGQFFEYWLNFTNDFKDIWKKEIIILTNELLKKMQQQHKLKSTTTQKPNKLKPGSLKDRLQRLGKK